MFLPLFSPPGTDSRIEFRRTTRCESAKKREGTRGGSFARGTVMLCERARDGIYKLQKRERVSRRRARCLNSTLVRNFVCEMSRWRRVGVLYRMTFKLRDAIQGISYSLSLSLFHATVAGLTRGWVSRMVNRSANYFPSAFPHLTFERKLCIITIWIKRSNQPT